ncbi:MAG: TIGR03617 family F420-dependent LLM class oxidoreductase [Dehalococcoidia bacterium]
MKVETGIPFQLGSIAEAVRRIEAMGYDGIIMPEVGHDPLLPLILAAEHSERLTLSTAVMIAFPRAPMTVAQAGWDLQRYSKGRLNIGLGSQVKGHNVRRYQTHWDTPPAPRMRQYVQCLRAIWDSWQNGTRPDFVTENYKYTLMTPNFNPGPLDIPPPRVMISAVNPVMAKVAGEVCDGLRLHGFNTMKYAREVLLPKVQEGLARAGKSREDFEISGGGFIAMGANQAELEQNIEGVRRQLSFYGSTRSYQGVMDAHGWGDITTQLNSMSIQGKWDEMPKLISDDMVEEFAAVGTYDNIVAQIEKKFGGEVDTIAIGFPPRDPDEEARAKELIAAIQRIPTPLRQKVAA